MSTKLKFIGLIPARKGSKGLLNKNILNLCSKPLVQHTIDAALGASFLDEVWEIINESALAGSCLGSGMCVMCPSGSCL